MPRQGDVDDKGLTYAQAEKLLAGLYRAPDRARENAFRGRLKHLKRLKIPLGSSPGRGAKIRYDFDQVCQWALCLELAEVGMDPAAVADLITRSWRSSISGLFDSATQSEDPLYLVIYPDMMSKNWASGTSEVTFVYAQYAEDFFLRMTGSKRRAILINLSELVRNLDISP